MRVLVAIESRFDRTPDGKVWAVGWADYSFWTRYLDVFDEVCVVARVRELPSPPPTGVRADGPAVSFAPVPYYIGPWQFARRYWRVRNAVIQALAPDDAVILRAPGTLANLLAKRLIADRRRFGVEVVGDPLDVFGAGGVRTVLQPLLRAWFPRTLRKQCANACAVAYVTAKVLQRRYPAAANAFSTSYSTIDLPDEAFVREPRAVRPANRPARLIFVGSLEQLYKGPDVLIEAVALAVAKGADLSITIVGEGKHRSELDARVRARGLSDRIRFTGNVPPGESVRKELDQADLFVLPSRTEGLPRALIEAMARGLPCLASSVGGIPELLSSSELVPPDDSDALAAKISSLIDDLPRMSRLSYENLTKADRYHAAVLQPTRLAFYQTVRRTAERAANSRTR